MTFFGLSEREAEASRCKNGLNELLYKTSLWKELLHGYCSMSCRLLAIAVLARISSMLLELIFRSETSVGFPTVLLCAAAVCGIAEGLLRYRSRTLLGRLCSSAGDGMYTVFRENGKTERVPRSMIAVGDVVYLSVGDEIPADGVMTGGTLTVDQSAFGLLGKAEKTPPPAEYRPGNKAGVNDPYSVHGGSVVCGGGGAVKVTAVGENTRIAGKRKAKFGQVYGESSESAERIGVIVGIAAAAAAMARFAVSGISAEGADLFSVLFAAAEGISAAASVLAVSCFCGKNLIREAAAAGAVKRLAAKGARLSEIRVLSAARETGALLIGDAGMVTEAEYGSAFIDGSGKQYGDFGKLEGKLAEAVRNAVASTSSAKMADDGTVLGGNAADRALYGFVGRKMRDTSDIKRHTEVKTDNSNVLRGATVTVGGKLRTFVRGGAEILLERCSDSISAGGKKQKITNKEALIKLAETLSLTAGKSVIALAVSERGIKGGRLPSDGYTLIGLAALNVSIFKNAADEVKRLERSGVRVMLVTAESRESAVYTAKAAGIKSGGGVVLSSEQLAKMSDRELSEKFTDIKAVVRAVPSDRRRLIRAAHEKGLTVCASADEPKALKASGEADWTIAAPGCETAVLSGADASAEGCGIKAAADIISFSAKYSAQCTARFVFRAVCAAAAAVLVFLSQTPF